mmetsp:Transcript_101370/g.275550  ORF Transcript_101370/g.275550 Transcript_101370/m.275550 type:complete len:200 (+) Transcript_101370:1343-1942(+)
MVVRSHGLASSRSIGTSGAVYDTVPMGVRVVKRSRDFANPKSHTITENSSSVCQPDTPLESWRSTRRTSMLDTSTFSSFRSRCTTPRAWQNETASESWATMCDASASFRGTVLCTTCEKRWLPGTKSVTMNTWRVLSEKNAPSREMMPGWLETLRSASTSREAICSAARTPSGPPTKPMRMVSMIFTANTAASRARSQR